MKLICITNYLSIDLFKLDTVYPKEMIHGNKTHTR